MTFNARTGRLFVVTTQLKHKSRDIKNKSVWPGTTTIADQPMVLYGKETQNKDTHTTAKIQLK